MHQIGNYPDLMQRASQAGPMVVGSFIVARGIAGSIYSLIANRQKGYDVTEDQAVVILPGFAWNRRCQYGWHEQKEVDA
jgi:hypothetical protein